MDMLRLTLYILLCTLPITDYQQCILIAGTSLGQHGISYKILRSYYASSPTLFKAMNSNSIVDRAIQVCFKDFQDTVALSIAKT